MKKIVPPEAILIPDNATRVFKGQIFDVYQWQQTLFDGRSKTFEMLKRPDTVQAVIIQDDKLLLVRDDQPHRGLKLTLPGGRTADGDASWLDTAKREVLEETGLRLKNWRLVNVRQPQLKIEWFGAVYLAWGVSDQRATNHDAGGEKIEPVLLDFATAKKRIMADARLQYIQLLFEGLNSADDLLALPEFPGCRVDR